VQFLAEKYHTDIPCKTVDKQGQQRTDISRLDKDLAPLHSMTAYDYGATRRRIENKLGVLLNEAEAAIDEHKQELLTDYVLVLANSYYVNEKRGYPFNDLILTATPKMAKVFHAPSPLEVMGFSKLSLDEWQARCNER
jgi:hypothetical protein